MEILSSNPPRLQDFLKYLFAAVTIHIVAEITQTPTTCLRLTIETLEYMFKVQICSKLAIKTPERRQWRRSSVFIVNFELISHLDLVFLLLTLNM